MKVSLKIESKFILLGAVIIFTLLNLFFILQARYRFLVKEREAEDANKPPEFTLTYIKDPACADCFEIELVEKEIDQLGGVIKNRKIIESSSKEGESLIEQYAIVKIPTVLIKGDLYKKEQLKELWPKIGRIVDDVLVLDYIQPPYIDLAAKTKRGEFEIIFLTDSSCKECYDATLHQNALEGMAMKTNTQRMVDRFSDEGKKFIAEYKIDKLPTAILRGDLASYEVFTQVWPQVGSNEKDNVYVFRNVELMGAYRDLKTGKVVGSNK